MGWLFKALEVSRAKIRSGAMLNKPGSLCHGWRWGWRRFSFHFKKKQRDRQQNESQERRQKRREGFLVGIFFFMCTVCSIVSLRNLLLASYRSLWFILFFPAGRKLWAMDRQSPDTPPNDSSKSKRIEMMKAHKPGVKRKENVANKN